VHYGTHPESAFSEKEGNFFMLGNLYEIAILRLKKDTTNLKVEN